MPGIGTMCYMVSDNPMDPNSWVFKGYYGPGVAGNNHTHLQKFQGKYYHIYHDHGSILLDVMKDKGVVDASAGDYRSICVNKATVNESTATVNLVTLNHEGVEQIKNLNPYEWQQAETMVTCAGIKYEDFTNIKKNGRISDLGNDASENMQVKMAEGSWTLLKKVDFGTNGASKITVRAKGEGIIEFRFSRKGAKAAVSFSISSDEMQDYVVEVNPTKFNGTKSIYIVASSGTVYFDGWQASDATTSIQEVENSTSVNNIVRYDLSGRRLSGTSQHHGIVIEQYTDNNGVRHTRKMMSE